MTSATPDILIIGAGLAGLACAGDLVRAGNTVLLLDKGRGVGGRAATRRFEDARTDHGAQYFTARGDRLRGIVAEGEASGWVREWCRGYPAWENGALTPRAEGHPRYCCPEGMNALPKQLARGLTAETGATVVSVRQRAAADRHGSEYVAETADGRLFAGKRLVLNLPPAQLLTLARPLLPPDTVTELDAVAYDPAWTLLLRLAADVPGADWPALEVKGHPALGFVARDHTRRAPGAPPVLVAHGSGAWSRAHLEDAPAEVEAALRAAVAEVAGPVEGTTAQVHRWRYASPTRPFPAPFLWLPEAGIGACGDWCAPGGRVEGALESGWALAAAMA